MPKNTAHHDLLYFRGRVALYAILKALGVRPGDQIATQAFTCVAVPEGILALGARPIYVDIQADEFNMDPSDLQEKLGPRVKAVIVQHTYGIPADIPSLQAVCNPLGVPIIEDCCHCFDPGYENPSTGALGLASFFSYEWGKPLVAGIGGKAKPNDPGLAAEMRRQYDSFLEPPRLGVLRLQLQYFLFKLLYRPRLYWPVRSLFRRLGSAGIAKGNYHDLASSGGISEEFSLRMAPSMRRRLERLQGRIPAQAAHRSAVVRHYRQGIQAPTVRHPLLASGSDPALARYPLITEHKAAYLELARRHNIELADWYDTPVHPLKEPDWGAVCYKAGSCPNAEMRGTQVVTLPTHGAVARSDVRRTLRFFREAPPLTSGSCGANQ